MYDHHGTGQPGQHYTNRKCPVDELRPRRVTQCPIITHPHYLFLDPTLDIRMSPTFKLLSMYSSSSSSSGLQGSTPALHNISCNLQKFQKKFKRKKILCFYLLVTSPTLLSVDHLRICPGFSPSLCSFRLLSLMAIHFSILSGSLMGQEDVMKVVIFMVVEW